MNFFRRHAASDTTVAATQIPVLDLAPYLARRAGAQSALADALRRACQEVGFFYVQGHGVPQPLIDEAFAQNRRFHALPLERKREVRINQNNVGYLAMNASIQRHSTVHAATRPNQSTRHGVIVEGERDRYSIAYFHSPDPYSTIRVAPSCVDAEHPAKYEPVDYADLIPEFWRANYAHQEGHGSVQMNNRYG